MDRPSLPRLTRNPSAQVGICYVRSCARKALLFLLLGDVFGQKGREAVGSGHRNTQGAHSGASRCFSRRVSL